MKKSFQLSIEALENRETPATWSSYPIGPITIPDNEWVPVGSISLDPYGSGKLTVVGTEYADNIRIEPLLFEASQDAFTLKAGGGNAVFSEHVRVRVMDANGVARIDSLGNALDQYFRASAVSEIHVEALGGDDQVTNTSNEQMLALGGEGNDSLTAGASVNKNALGGDGGNDRLVGSSAADVMNGGPGNDTISGEGGDDFLDGGDQDDFITGGAGNDTIEGGDGADLLGGDADDDTIRGGAANDVQFGGTGNDNLYGGPGQDQLRGEGGLDGLFGGDGQDLLSGGPGVDRFLFWKKPGNSATILGLLSSEALISFKGTTTQQVIRRHGLDLRYSPQEWFESEIEETDAGLAWVHAQTGNCKLLRLKDGRELTMMRYGNYIPFDANDGTNDATDAAANKEGTSWLGMNGDTGLIRFRSDNATGNGISRDTTVHELAHNWENENPRWKGWLVLSGWRKSNSPQAGEVLSGDGQWVFRESALLSFVREHGKENPYEDFATMFEEYYVHSMGRLGHPTPPMDWADKLTFIEQFIASLR